MIDKKSITLDMENFAEAMEEIGIALREKKATQKEINNAELVLEETFMRLHEKGGAQSACVTVLKHFGSINLRLASSGKEFNPLIEATHFDEEDVDFYRVAILKANNSKMAYARKGDLNIVTVNVHEPGSKQIYQTLAGMILGILCGVLIKEILSPDLVAAFDKNIVKTFRTIFLNALSMMMVPVIFFSVISGVTSITNAADIGRIGGKLMGIYAFTTVAASFISLLTGVLFFGGEVPQLGVTGGAPVETTPVSFVSTIVGIVPKNLIAPIEDGNMLQVIFLAVVCGICINKLNDKVKILRDIIDAMNHFCLRMITMIVAFIPFIAFLSMASLIINIGLDSMWALGKLILGQLGGSLTMVMMYVLMIFAIGHITPVPFLRKIPSFVAVPLSTSSSNATMPFSLKFCEEKMGISPKLSSFSIPVGATVNMDGGCLYLATASIMLARMFGVEIDYNVLFTVFVTVVALSVGAPGVPGAALVCLASIVSALGLPAEATAVVLGIDPICSMLRTALNTVGDIAATTILAKNEKLINEEVYLKI